MDLDGFGVISQPFLPHATRHRPPFRPQICELNAVSLRETRGDFPTEQNVCEEPGWGLRGSRAPSPPPATPSCRGEGVSVGRRAPGPLEAWSGCGGRGEGGCPGRGRVSLRSSPGLGDHRWPGQDGVYDRFARARGTDVPFLLRGQVVLTIKEAFGPLFCIKALFSFLEHLIFAPLLCPLKKSYSGLSNLLFPY